MTRPLAISTDYQMFDGVVDLTLKPQYPVGSSIACKGMVRKMSFNEMMWVSSQGFDSTVQAFTVFVNSMSTSLIKIMDHITDAAGNTWIVKSAELVTFSSRWRVVCVLSQ